MPVSSLVPAVVGHSRSAELARDDVPADLLVVLRSVTDPRARRGVRHRCGAVLAIAVCAVLAGARSYLAIAEWAHDLTPAVRARLGLGRRAPCESTIRRVLQGVDAEQLDRLLSAWLSPPARVEAPAQPAHPVRPVIAVDGKTARGARPGGAPAVHLLAAFHTDTGVVLGQHVVDGKTNEINAFAPLLARVDITGTIITADALHTQRGHVTYLTGRGAHYLLRVKANQPTLLRQLRALPRQQIPVTDRTRDKGHGRREERTVQLAAITAGIAFPGAALAIRITRRRQPLTGTRRQTPDRLRDHRPELRTDQRGGARRRRPRALGHREPAALGPRRLLR